MTDDLTRLLSEWEYDPDHTMRIIAADDGRSVLQVRLPLGIEQYELTGRPDGERPFGRATVLEEIESRLEEYVTTNGTDSGFSLDHKQCVMLQNEGLLFYYRYLLLFQLNDFERVATDTEHNLRLCGVLERYCDDAEDKNAVLQYKPYIVRMNAMSRAMSEVQSHASARAEGILNDAIQTIESMNEIDTPAFQFEKIRSVNYLRSALKQVQSKEDNPVKELERELDIAVEEENYERAAELRDRIREMSS
jgi:excinuclease UvrABC helicase subunit UvrB